MIKSEEEALHEVKHAVDKDQKDLWKYHKKKLEVRIVHVTDPTEYGNPYFKIEYKVRHWCFWNKWIDRHDLWGVTRGWVFMYNNTQEKHLSSISDKSSSIELDKPVIVLDYIRQGDAIARDSNMLLEG